MCERIGPSGGVKKVLFISTLLPTKLGGMRSLYYNLVEFSKRFEVHFIRVRCGMDERRVLIDLPESVKASTVECRGLSPDPLSLLFPLHWKSMARIRSAQPAIQSYIDENGIDAVITHSMDVTFALRGLRARVKSGYQLDSFASYYGSKWRATRSPAALAMWAGQSLLFRLIEWELFRNYNLLAYVSSADAPRGKGGRALVMCQAQDPPYKKKNSGRRKLDVVVFGRWEHPPNRDGLARVAGKLGTILGSVSIIGPNLNPALPLPKNARALGMVQDIEPFWSGAKVCLIPVWYGAGLQTKVFDALRHGCVVATTPFTKRSFEANGFSSPSILASDDPVSLANEALLHWSPEKSRKAYAAYGKFYSKNRLAVGKYADRIARLLEP